MVPQVLTLKVWQEGRTLNKKQRTSKKCETDIEVNFTLKWRWNKVETVLKFKSLIEKSFLVDYRLQFFVRGDDEILVRFVRLVSELDI